ncbi:hypothetical protein Hanom_Chr14g01253901 [Helianthus anomalus]
MFSYRLTSRVKKLEDLERWSDFYAIEETYNIENEHLNSRYRDRQEHSSESDLVEIHVGPATDLDHEYFNHKKMYCDG